MEFEIQVPEVGIWRLNLIFRKLGVESWRLMLDFRESDVGSSKLTAARPSSYFIWISIVKSGPEVAISKKLGTLNLLRGSHEL